MIIALAYKVANDSKNGPSTPQVYHSSSASSNPITFGEMYRLAIDVGNNYPPSYIAWVPQLRFHESKLVDDIDRFITHRLFAYLMDNLLVIFGQEAKATKIYDQIVKNYEVVRFAHTQPINILSDNYKSIIASMSSNDQSIFYFDPLLIKWKQYNQDICFGTRKYFWREKGDPLESSVGKKKLRVIKLVLFVLRTLAAIAAYYGLKKTGKYVLSKM
ncbi:putative fatty acyl-CoA reductase CG5065 [Chironomus tepperi]|uniref:putative fatty acyl-CoA reductase CG5065 n=1 Tax=Chironomus tepperi TaxID=113505 RepID=UPI00391F8AE1